MNEGTGVVAQAGAWILAAIVWGSVFSHDLILFSAHPVWTSNPKHSALVSQLTYVLTATQLRRAPLLHPRHPRCSADPHRKAKEGRHICARRTERHCPSDSYRRAGRDRIQQDQPQRNPLPVAARYSWPDHIHPHGSAGRCWYYAVLCPAAVRRRGQRQEAIQVPSRRWICDPTCDAGYRRPCNADGLQQERAADPALGCLGRCSDLADRHRAAHQAQQVWMVGWKLASDASLMSSSIVWNSGFMWMIGLKTATENAPHGIFGSLIGVIYVVLVVIHHTDMYTLHVATSQYAARAYRILAPSVYSELG
jgi:hypothetical protein